MVNSSRTESTFIGEPGEGVYNACHNTVAECSFGLKNQMYDGTLSTTGVILGRVEDISEVISSLDDLLEGLNRLQWLVNPVHQVLGVLWRTLVADRDHAGRNPPRWYQRACHYWLTQESLELELVTAYLKRVERVVFNRRLFSYEGQPGGVYEIGGVGPGNVQPGDIVCILFGCSVPIILREDEESIGSMKSYRLIGEGYVHRKMEGEHFLGHSRESIWAQALSFSIR